MSERPKALSDILVTERAEPLWADYPPDVKNTVGFGVDEEGNRYCLRVTGNWCGAADAALIYERCWAEWMAQDQGFCRGKVNPSLCYKKDLIVGTFVDDSFYYGSDQAAKEFEKKLNQRWGDCKCRPVDFLLGMNVDQAEDGTIQIRVESTIFEMAKRFGVQDCSPVYTPLPPKARIDANQGSKGGKVFDKPRRELTGCLQWLAITCRPSLSFAAAQLARVSSNPGEQHWKLALHALKYAWATRAQGLKFSPSANRAPTIDCFVDAAWAGAPGHIGDDPEANPDALKSSCGCIIRVDGAPAHWSSKVLKTIAMSSTESELCAAWEATKDCLWLKQSLEEHVPNNIGAITLYEDNQPVLKLMEEQRLGMKRRSRWIAARWLKTRELIKNGELKMLHVGTKDNLADIFTKSTAKPTLEHLHRGIETTVDRPIAQFPFAATTHEALGPK